LVRFALDGCHGSIVALHDREARVLGHIQPRSKWDQRPSDRDVGPWFGRPRSVILRV
jgi:hypothetical protein